MDSTHLTPQQIDRMNAILSRHLKYLDKIIHRAQVLRWPDDDPVGREALRAREAVMRLVTAVRGAGPRPPGAIM